MSDALELLPLPELPPLSKKLKLALFKNPLKIAPRLQVLAVPIDSLHLDPTNANEHPADNLATIRHSMERVGQLKALVALEDGTIKAGNGTWMVAKEMGATHIAVVYIPADVAEYADEFALADNQAAHMSRFQPDRLKAMIEKVRARGTNTNSLGFSNHLLKELLAKAKKPKVAHNWETAGEKKEPRRSQVGDLWQLGPHRLVVGDCTDPLVIKRLMGERKAQCVFTDPPYNVDYEDRRDRSIANDKMSDEEFEIFLIESFKNMATATVEDAAFYIWYADKKHASMLKALETAGLEWRRGLVWFKNQWGIGWHYRPQHEPCVYAAKKGPMPRWFGDHSQSTVWAVDKDAASDYAHPNQKPVALATLALENSTQVGQVVLDPFCGSGSTLGAAEFTNRIAYLVELDPKWADTVIARWEKMTTEKAVKDE